MRHHNKITTTAPGRDPGADQTALSCLAALKVTVTAAGLEVDIRREGIAGVVREMVAPRRVEAAE